MDIRLNKLISDAGICSRREADEFIRSGRVTVNGKKPKVGQKIIIRDVVKVDDEPISVGKYLQRQEKQRAAAQEEKAQWNRMARPLELGKKKKTNEHYGKFNPYAAKRKAQKALNEAQDERGTSAKRLTYIDQEMLKEAMTPRFKKSLSKQAIIQRIAANPKSAALRKTSRNNPINKAIRAKRRRS